MRDLTHRLVAAVLLLASMLAACGGRAAPAAGPSPPTVASSPAARVAPTAQPSAVPTAPAVASPVPTAPEPSPTTVRATRTPKPPPERPTPAPPKPTTTPQPTATPRPVALYVDAVGGAPLRMRADQTSRSLATIPHRTRVSAAPPAVKGKGGQWLFVRHERRTGYVHSARLVAAQPPPAPTPTPVAAQVGLPQRLVIGTGEVEIDAAVEHVAETPEGAMEVPKAWENVGWYRLGVRPGEPGNAVIAGHLDSTTGAAVFWDLRRLRPGDEVRVVDDAGETVRFRVRELRTYYTDNAPLLEIFGGDDEAHLNLVTCDGAFNRGVGQYDQRLVVFTDKIG